MKEFMASPTIENYIKRIFMLGEKSGEELVPLGILATALGVTAGTVTTMIKTMAEADLVDYQVRQGVRLTGRGRRLALHVLRRHRVIELYLVNRLGMDWGEVHEEAEVLEHSVSDRVLSRMEEVLGDTSLDPHGAPIPDGKGVLHDARKLVSLDRCEATRTVTVAQVRQQTADFLSFLTQNHLTPGSRVRVEKVDLQAGIVEVRPQGRERISLSLETASLIDVEE